MTTPCSNSAGRVTQQYVANFANGLLHVAINDLVAVAVSFGQLALGRLQSAGQRFFALGPPRAKPPLKLFHRTAVHENCKGVGMLFEHRQSALDVNLQEYPLTVRKSSRHLTLKRSVPIAGVLLTLQKIARRTAGGKLLGRQKEIIEAF